MPRRDDRVIAAPDRQDRLAALARHGTQVVALATVGEQVVQQLAQGRIDAFQALVAGACPRASAG